MSDFNDFASVKSTGVEGGSHAKDSGLVSTGKESQDTSEGLEVLHSNSNRDSLNLEDFEKVDAEQLKQFGVQQDNEEKGVEYDKEKHEVDLLGEFEASPKGGTGIDYQIKLDSKPDNVLPSDPNKETIKEEVVTIEKAISITESAPLGSSFTETEILASTLHSQFDPFKTIPPEDITFSAGDDTFAFDKPLISPDGMSSSLNDDLTPPIKEPYPTPADLSPDSRDKSPGRDISPSRESNYLEQVIYAARESSPTERFMEDVTKEPSPPRESDTPLKEVVPSKESVPPQRESSPPVKEPSPHREPFPPPREPSPVREPTPLKEVSPPPREISPPREPTPPKAPSLPPREPSPPREPTPPREPSLPPRELSPIREPSPKEASPPPREPSPAREPTPPKEVSPPPKEPSPIREPTPPREPSPIKEPTPPREITPPKEPTPPREPSPPREITPPREPTPPRTQIEPLVSEETSQVFSEAVETKIEHFTPLSSSVPAPSKTPSGKGKYTSSESSTIMKNLALVNPMVNLIYWRDVKKSAIVFGAVMLVLLSLTYFSLISVVAYTSLAVLVGTAAFRIYKNIMQAVQKSQDGHPFKEYLELDTNLQPEKVHEATDVLVSQVNSTVSELKRLFLVEDLIDSFKFGCLLWCLTYVGSWFNGLTIIILSFVALFTLPKVYEQNQTQIDQYLGMVRSQVNEVMTKVKAAVPIGNKEKAQ